MMRIDSGKAALAGLAFITLLASTLLWRAFAQSAEELPVATADRLSAEGVLVQAMDFHEVCTGLQPQEVMHYAFEASKPLDFDIHFHDAGLIYTPVEVKAVKAHEGEFLAETPQVYCFMWTSRSLKDTWLSFEVSAP